MTFERGTCSHCLQPIVRIDSASLAAISAARIPREVPVVPWSECASVILPGRSFSSGGATVLYNSFRDRCRSPRCVFRACGPAAAACAACGAGRTPRSGHVVPYGHVMAVGHEAPGCRPEVGCMRRAVRHEDVYRKYVHSTRGRGGKTRTTALQTSTNMHTHHHSSHAASACGALEDDADGARAAPGARAPAAELTIARAVRVVELPQPAPQKGVARVARE